MQSSATSDPLQPVAGLRDALRLAVRTSDAYEVHGVPHSVCMWYQYGNSLNMLGAHMVSAVRSFGAPHGQCPSGAGRWVRAVTVSGRVMLGVLAGLPLATAQPHGPDLHPVWQHTVPGMDAEGLVSMRNGLRLDAVDGSVQLLGLGRDVLWDLQVVPGSVQPQVQQMPLTGVVMTSSTTLHSEAGGLLLSQVVHGHAVFLDRCVLLRLQEDGSPRWQVNLYSRSYCPPKVLAREDGGAIYVNEGKVMAVNGQGHAQRWLPTLSGSVYWVDHLMGLTAEGRVFVAGRLLRDGHSQAFVAVLDSRTGRLRNTQISSEGQIRHCMASRSLLEGGFETLCAGAGFLLRLHLNDTGHLLSTHTIDGVDVISRKVQDWSDGFVLLNELWHPEAAAPPRYQLLMLDHSGVRWQRMIPADEAISHPYHSEMAVSPAGTVALNRLRFDAHGTALPSLDRPVLQLGYDKAGLLWVLHPLSQEAELVAYPPDSATAVHAVHTELMPLAVRMDLLDARADGSVHLAAMSLTQQRLYLQSLDARGALTHSLEVPWTEGGIRAIQRVRDGWMILTGRGARESMRLSALDLSGQMLWHREEPHFGSLLCNERDACVLTRRTEHGEVLERLEFTGEQRSPEISVAIDATIHAGPVAGSLRLLQTDLANGDSLLHTLDVWPPQLLTRAPRFQYGSVRIVANNLLSTHEGGMSLYSGIHRVWTRAAEIPWSAQANRYGQLRHLKFVDHGFEWTTIDPRNGQTVEQRDVQFPALGDPLSIEAAFAAEHVDWFVLRRNHRGTVWAVPRGQPQRIFATDPQSLTALPDGAAVVSWLQGASTAQPQVQVARLHAE